MRTAVIGSKKLSVDILHTLLEQGHEVVFVITRDKEKGMEPWLSTLAHPALSEEAARFKIPAYEGMSVRSDASHNLVREARLDVIFSCFWGEIFREPLLSLPRLGIFNFHTAYLPHNRGSRPIPWALIEGDKYTGMTIHRMDEGVDSGPMLTQVKVDISEGDTAESLYDKVCEAGISLFNGVLPLLASGGFELKPQKEENQTYHPRGEPYGGQIHAGWDEGLKNRFRRAFHFPPFRAHREAPQTVAELPRLYVVTAGAEVCAYTWETRLDALRRNSIGTKAERAGLKEFFGFSESTRAGVRGVILHGREGGISGYFATHDVLQQNGVEYVVSDVRTAVGELPEPFRYENGLLEIPSFRWSAVRAEVESLLSGAASQSLATGRDVFIGLVDEFVDGRAIAQEIEKFGTHSMTFAQVCAHYNTAYESIGP